MARPTPVVFSRIVADGEPHVLDFHKFLLVSSGRAEEVANQQPPFMKLGTGGEIANVIGLSVPGFSLPEKPRVLIA